MGQDIFELSSVTGAIQLLDASNCSYIIDDPKTGQRHQKGSIMIDAVIGHPPMESKAPPPRKGKYVEYYRDAIEKMEYGVQTVIQIPDCITPNLIDSFCASVSSYAARTFGAADEITRRHVKGETVVRISRSRKVA